MLVIYPQPAGLTPITSDCARPNITDSAREHRHIGTMCNARSSLADYRQQRRSRGSYTSGLSMIMMGSQDFLAVLLAVISWLQRRWRSTLGRTSSTLRRASHHLGLAVRFLKFSRPISWAVIWQDFAPPIIYQHSTARPQEMSLKSHFPLESKCLHNMANFGKRAYQKETLGAKTLKSNNM